MIGDEADSVTTEQNIIEVLIDNEVTLVNVDYITELLMKSKGLTEVHVPEIDVIALCEKTKEIFLTESVLLELHSPITIIGDTHGHLPELMKWFKIVGMPSIRDYLFLGNYINRGKYSLETIMLLMCYKIKYPNSFFMLRGNHETPHLAKAYGFLNDCKKRYNTRLYKIFLDLFSYMPLVAIIEDRIFCCHGGLSPDLHNMDQIRKLHRPTELGDQGLVCDLLWADPSTVNGWGVNERGISVTFGPDIVNKFLTKFEMDLICRGHQVVEDGYEFFAKRQGLTLFSAPNYCGEYDNAGAILSVGETLQCVVKIIKSMAVASAACKTKFNI